MVPNAAGGLPRPHAPTRSTAFTGQIRKQLPQWRQRLKSITRGTALLMQPEGHTLRHPWQPMHLSPSMR